MRSAAVIVVHEASEVVAKTAHCRLGCGAQKRPCSNDGDGPLGPSLATRFGERHPALKAAADLIDDTTVMSATERRKAMTMAGGDGGTL